MAYVVTEPCLDCVYTDCDACVGECPVHAIYPEADVPPQWKNDVARNRDECEKHPVIAEKIRAQKGPKCVNPNAARD